MKQVIIRLSLLFLLCWANTVFGAAIKVLPELVLDLVNREGYRVFYLPPEKVLILDHMFPAAIGSIVAPFPNESACCKDFMDYGASFLNPDEVLPKMLDINFSIQSGSFMILMKKIDEHLKFIIIVKSHGDICFPRLMNGSNNHLEMVPLSRENMDEGFKGAQDIFDSAITPGIQIALDLVKEGYRAFYFPPLGHPIGDHAFCEIINIIVRPFPDENACCKDFSNSGSSFLEPDEVLSNILHRHFLIQNGSFIILMKMIDGKCKFIIIGKSQEGNIGFVKLVENPNHHLEMVPLSIENIHEGFKGAQDIFDAPITPGIQVVLNLVKEGYRVFHFPSFPRIWNIFSEAINIIVRPFPDENACCNEFLDCGNSFLKPDEVLPNILHRHFLIQNGSFIILMKMIDGKCKFIIIGKSQEGYICFVKLVENPKCPLEMVPLSRENMDEGFKCAQDIFDAGRLKNIQV